MLLPSAPMSYRSRDTEHRYRPDSELYYTTGLEEQGAVALLLGGPEPRFVLFVLPRDHDAELWAGPRLGPEEAKERTGADECYSTTELEARLPALLEGARLIQYRARAGDGVGRYVTEALADARTRGARKGLGPRGVVDPGEILDELRLRKDPAEVECIRTAVAVTLEGHRAGAAAIHPGTGEWDVEAAIEGGFRRAGAAGPCFGTIVGSGENACVLHYVANSATIGGGALVLVDAGAEVRLYNGDVTRTYPSNGRFSAIQRDVYEVVEAAHGAAIAKVAPGVALQDVHGAAVAAITEGLVSLGVLEGSVEVLVEGDAYRPYFPHRTSHWLGIDVHDPGDYIRSGTPRVLEAGMVFTVEPGLYFRPGHLEGGADRFSGIGVRIEDDVLVTETGCEILTGDLPTGAEDVESLVGHVP